MNFFMASSTDHISGIPGITPTATISKDGAAFAAPSGAVTETGNGWYKLAGNATDRNTLGPLLLHATGAGADPTDLAFDVVGYDPYDGVGLGLTAIPTLSRYLVLTGGTTPATADLYTVVDYFNNSPLYRGKATGLFIWNAGSGVWTISAAAGTNGSAYWTTASNSTASGPYANQGTATGVPAVAPHGNAVLSAYQPDVPFPAGFSGLTATAIATAVQTDVSDTLGADIVATAAQVAALSTAVAALAAAVAAIKAQTDQLAGEVAVGTVADTQATATSFKGAAGLPTVDNAFRNMIVLFTSGNLVPRTALVTAYAGASRQFTVRAGDLWTNPSDGDTFQVLGLGA